MALQLEWDVKVVDRFHFDNIDRHQSLIRSSKSNRIKTKTGGGYVQLRIRFPTLLLILYRRFPPRLVVMIYQRSIKVQLNNLYSLLLLLPLEMRELIFLCPPQFTISISGMCPRLSPLHFPQWLLVVVVSRLYHRHLNQRHFTIYVEPDSGNDKWRAKYLD